jgi:hypothetical protein
MARRITYATPEERATSRTLQQLPNIGPAMAHDLMRLGIASAGDLAARDPDELYAALCALDGTQHDPCVLDTFMAAVDAARGLPARPWWEYTPLRKARQDARTDAPRHQPPGNG